MSLSRSSKKPPTLHHETTKMNPPPLDAIFPTITIVVLFESQGQRLEIPVHGSKVSPLN